MKDSFVAVPSYYRIKFWQYGGGNKISFKAELTNIFLATNIIASTKIFFSKLSKNFCTHNPTKY